MSMDFYNYMLIIQQEAMKAIIKKQLNIGYQIDSDSGDVYLADSANQSFFLIPKNYFVFDTNKLKAATVYEEIFKSSIQNGHSIGVTPEIMQTGKTTQLRKLHDPENDLDVWINNKFLGYFKNNRTVMYNYFWYGKGKLVFAYDSTNFKVLGITVEQRPKR